MPDRSVQVPRFTLQLRLHMRPMRLGEELVQQVVSLLPVAQGRVAVAPTVLQVERSGDPNVRIDIHRMACAAMDDPHNPPCSRLVPQLVDQRGGVDLAVLQDDTRRRAILGLQGLATPRPQKISHETQELLALAPGRQLDLRQDAQHEAEDIVDGLAVEHERLAKRVGGELGFPGDPTDDPSVVQGANGGDVVETALAQTRFPQLLLNRCHDVALGGDAFLRKVMQQIDATDESMVRQGGLGLLSNRTGLLRRRDPLSKRAHRHVPGVNLRRRHRAEVGATNVDQRAHNQTSETPSQAEMAAEEV